MTRHTKLWEQSEANPRRKVALFVPALHGGGAERVMTMIAKALVEGGIEVDFLLVRPEGPYLQELPSSVRVVPLGPRHTLTSVPALARYLRKHQPAALLSTLDNANVAAVWAKKMARVSTRIVLRKANTPRPAHERGKSARARLMPLLVRHSYPWADAVIAVSHGVAQALVQHAGIAAHKLHVIYNPVVPERLTALAESVPQHPWLAPGEPPVVLGAGRLTPQKDFSTLIRAFAVVRAAVQARLIIIGEGKERPTLEALVQELGLEHCVSLPGFTDSPFSYMKRAAVFVLSSSREGMPNALIEALALGTPVISTDCPAGPAEVLEQGRWGRLVPVGDHVALGQAILKALHDPAPRASSEAVSRFALDRVVSEYQRVLLGDPG